jgi:sensor histidine kinase YesM
MHKQRIGIHIVTWTVLYVFWITVLQNRSLTLSRTLTVQFCYLLFIAGNYYFQRYFTIPRFLYQKKYLSFTVTLLGGIGIAALLRTGLALYMTGHVFQPGGTPPSFSSVFGDSLLNIAFWTIALLAIHLVVERIRFRQYIDTIEKEKTKNELDFLKAQFNPHFLFNSINSIYGHIDKSNPTARNMLLSFSEMLRYQLYERHRHRQGDRLYAQLCYFATDTQRRGPAGQTDDRQGRKRLYDRSPALHRLHRERF